MPPNDRQIKNAKLAAKPYKLADGGYVSAGYISGLAAKKCGADMGVIGAAKIFPTIGSEPITEIMAGQIKAMIEGITGEDNFGTARIVLQKAKAVFNYAVLLNRASD